MSQLDGTLLDSLWDFSDPAASEQQLREARESAERPARDELSTQIARALGLQGKYDEAMAELDAIESDNPVVLQRIALERGRVLNSSGDSAAATPHFVAAYEAAADAFLTVDALHMLAIVEPAGNWAERGLAAARASTDPRVRRWEGGLLNNQAWSLADAGEESAALEVFREAEQWFATHGKPMQLHIARWSVAHMLRRTGDPEAAREILLDLKANSEPDEWVDKELALLDEA